MLVHVNVRHIHIGLGRRGDAYNCPVSLAVKDVTEFKTCCVGHTTMWVSPVENDEHCTRQASVPESVDNFISRFDAGMGVEPFEFMIDI